MTSNFLCKTKTAPQLQIDVERGKINILTEALGTSGLMRALEAPQGALLVHRQINP